VQGLDGLDDLRIGKGAAIVGHDRMVRAVVLTHADLRALHPQVGQRLLDRAAAHLFAAHALDAQIGDGDRLAAGDGHFIDRARH
jgi:hypothetical protein